MWLECPWFSDWLNVFETNHSSAHQVQLNCRKCFFVESSQFSLYVINADWTCETGQRLSAFVFAVRQHIWKRDHECISQATSCCLKFIRVFFLSTCCLMHFVCSFILAQWRRHHQCCFQRYRRGGHKMYMYFYLISYFTRLKMTQFRGCILFNCFHVFISL